MQSMKWNTLERINNRLNNTEEHIGKQDYRLVEVI